MKIELLAPGWLALALLALLVWIWPRGRRDRVQALLRSLVIALLALALARPIAWRADEQERAVFVADFSPSSHAGERDRAARALVTLAGALPQRIRPELVTLGEPPSGAGLERAFPSSSRTSPAAGGSPLSAALSAAARAIPLGTRGSVTLVSDGGATDPGFADALFDLEERGLPLHVCALAPAEFAARPARLACDEPLRVGHSARIRLELAGVGRGLRVALHDGQGEIAVREGVDCAGQAALEFDYEPRSAGFVALEARVGTEDAPLRLARTFPVAEPLEVLYVGGRIEHGAAALGALLGPGFALRSYAPSDQGEPVDLGRYDLALIDDARADGVPDELEARLAQAVTDRGLGLVMCGGEGAFGPGGWADSPVAGVLPVECVQKEEKRDPSTTLVLIIDTSGSMGGERIQLAKEVARLAMARLLPHDKVGIVEFYGAKRWAAPIQPASNTIDLARAINRMDAEGGTVILPAIEEAYYGLKNVQTRYKHVLILTDGGVESGSFEPLLRRMADDGMAVSTVLIGPEAHSEFLVDLANWGKGRFYSVPDRFNLPEILLKQPTSSRLPAYEPGSFELRARAASGWWGAVDREAIPPIAGYVETSARPAAEVLLEVRATHHPLIATWRHGLGRVTTFASEPCGPGSEPWRAWPDAGRALARIFARTADTGRERFTLGAERRGREVLVRAERRRPGSERPRVVRLDAQGAELGPLALEEHADGLFEARLFVPPDESLRLVAPDADAPVYAVCDARSDQVDELAAGHAPRMDLARAARASGGDVLRLSELAERVPRAGGAAHPERLMSLAPLACLLSLALYLLEIFYRRRDRRRGRMLPLLLLALLVPPPVARAQAPAGEPKPLDAELTQACEALLAREDAPGADWLELQQRVLAREGESRALVTALEGAARGPHAEAAQRGLAWILYREGRLPEALKACDAALSTRALPELQLQRAQLLDALGRVEEARTAWRLARGSATTDAERDHIDLRLALLDAQPPVAGQYSALFTLAAEPGREEGFQNRAAVVLALLGRPREAIELYHARGEGRDRFRQEIRLAEWALAAKAPAEAQAHAWNARSEASLKRDRLYALTVLVEAHRADGSLDRLIGRCAAGGEQLDDETRGVWIDLLRETARVDEAMALFQRSAQGGFTPEMRRELLEMCREAGREEEFVDTYKKLIAAEPDRIEWREGLARYWLERGRREEAQAVWQAYVDGHPGVAYRMLSARAASENGLSELARACAGDCLADPQGRMEARLFLFELETRLGNLQEAHAQLEAFDGEVEPDAAQRVQLSEAFERAGDKARAARVLEGLRTARGADQAEEDLELRLAWLLSETGDEKLALERWKNLWRRVSSVARQRQIEDRLMAVAARLGVVADLAVELEQKLAAGQAEDRDAGLLVRLYNKVGDPVSAAEVIEEHLRKKGGGDVAVLEEQARVYLGGKDYFHYERAIRRLIELDPEHQADRLRQLAMSNLERGRPTEARAVLTRLAACESTTDAAEFEAGVLALAGLNEDAARTYRRGLAQHPERIDGFLLLANALRALHRTDEAIGMFQFLAETTDRDDLFTVAIDGVLNMRAKEPALRWARRVLLERIAGRDDKMYLYQLVSDLSEELEDRPGMLRALETSLAIAGEQRGPVLRQLMDASQGKGGITYIAINNVLVQRRTGSASEKRLAYGRRLIGLGELVPPQVYLELGEAFLSAGEVSNAAKTFSMARDVPDWGAFQRQVASSFEGATYAEQALAVYERLMASQTLDADLSLRAAQLHEQLGHDQRAAELYGRGLAVLLARQPLSATAAQKPKAGDEDVGWGARNVGEFEQYFAALTTGFLASASEERLRATFEAERALLEADLAAAAQLPPEGDAPRTLESLPRIRQRAGFLRRLGLRAGWLPEIAASDLALLARVPKEEGALDALCRERMARGYDADALRLIERCELSEEDRARARQRLGLGAGAGPGAGGADGGQLALGDLLGRILPLLIEGRTQELGLFLRRARVGAPNKDDLPFAQALVCAAVHARDEPAVLALTGYALRTTVAHGQNFSERENAYSLLQRARGALSPAAYDVLLGSFVQLVSDKDKTLQDFQYVLERLQEGRSQPLLSAETIRARIEKCVPDNEYMLPTLLGFVPAEARLGLLQPVWSRVPAKSRSYVAADILSSGEEPPEPRLAQFLVDSFAEGIAEVDEADSISYPLRTLLENERMPLEVVEKLVAQARKRWADNALFVIQTAQCKARRGDAEGALTELGAALPLMTQPEADWMVTNAIDALVQALGKERAPALLELLDRREAQDAAATDGGALIELRERAFDALDDPGRKRAWLEARLARKPGDVATLEALLDLARSAGEVPRERQLLEELLAAQPEKPQAREALVQFWTRQREPVRALEVRRAGESEGAAKKPASDAGKLAPASLVAVRKAVSAGQDELARSTYRRTWRSFRQSGNSFGFVRYYYGSGSRELLWPEDEAADTQAALERRRGGLSNVQLDKLDAAEKPKRGRPAYDVVAGLGFGAGELERQVRSLDDGALSGSRALLHGLQLAETARLGPETAVAQWTGRVQSASAGTVERALLLAWYEDHAGELAPDARALLSELVLAVQPLDGAQLRALARLYNKFGDSAHAANLYRWCGTLASERRSFFGSGQGFSVDELIDEVREQLSGEARVAAVESILASARPAGQREHDDELDALTLSTWLETLGPPAALARCRSLAERVSDPRQGLERAAALQAARLFAAAGELEPALRALETAIARLDEGSVRLERNQLSNRRWLLRARSPSFEDLGQLLPAGLGARGGEWYSRVVERLTAWHAAQRIEQGCLRSALLVAALRLQQQGALPAALVYTEQLDRLTGEGNAERLTTLDLYRRLGREPAARAIEDQLFAAHRLNPARVPELIERIRKESGDPAALRAAEGAADWTAEPKLLDQLVELNGALHADEARDRWQVRRTAAAAAAAELELTW